MALSVQEFWQVVVASGLHDEENCRRLADAFAKARETGAVARTVSLPEWMLASGAITRYQAKILLAGKPGPFVYGDYLVTDRLEIAGLPGLFRAVHRPTNINVALYFLSGTLTDPTIVTQLAHEAASAASLSRSGRGSAYLTHCHALVDLEAYKFLVVDELPTTTLADRLAGGVVLSPKEATRIVCQAALGLTRFGENHQAHGAVRPARIWLTSAGTARLATFPLARDPLAVVGAHALLEVDLAGVDYCAQECAAGEPATPHSDVYSLGCVFYEMLSGRVPFPTGDREQRLEQHRSATSRPLDEINGAIPKPLATLVARMLAENPADRAACLPTLLKQFGTAVDTAGLPEARTKLDAWLAEQGEVHRPSAAGPSGVVPVLFNPLDSTPVTATARRSRGRRSNNLLVVGAVAASVLLVGGLAFYFASGIRAPQRTLAPTVDAPPALATGEADSQVAPPGDNGTEAPIAASVGQSETAGSTTTANGEAAPSAAADTIVGVEGTMWAAPTHGAPVDLKYLAPGAEVIVALRPAQFVGNPEAEKLLDPRTLGALAEFISKELPALAGAPLSDIDEALIGALDSSSGAPRLAVVLTLREAPSLETLLHAWGDPAAQEKDGATFYKKGDRAFWLPTTDPPGKIVVIGPADLIAEDVIPAGDNPPALGRDIEELLAASDRERDLTILASPGLLQTASRDWFPSYAARLRAPLAWFLSGNETGAENAAAPETARAGDMRAIDMSSQGLPQAVLSSAHLSDTDLFLELRTITVTNQPAAALARAFRERLARLPKRVSEYIRTLELSDYSHDVLFDFPLMVEQVGRYTVVGTEGRQVVLRTYLPSVAAHNLALGSHLALAERPRQAVAGGTRPTAAKAPAGEPLAKRLDRKMSLVFDRATLEKALQMVGEEIGAEVEILGADLQLEGITKNQSFGLDVRDQTAREILRNIMMRASPDGKLIYVIRASAGGGAETLVITTRASARQRGEAVPAEFAEQP